MNMDSEASLTGRTAIVLGGRTGKVGQALCRELAARGAQPVAVGREDVNVLNTPELTAFLESHSPDLVFNGIAYTAVDQAEEDESAAFALNRSLPKVLGRLSREMDFKLVHFSTDFVFSGAGRSTPYEVDDPTDPKSVYGKSKLAGEQALLEIDPPGLAIIRTAWLFGPGGNNFVRTITGLCRDRDELTIVHDQIGSPTFTVDLAAHSLDLVQAGGSGLFHIVNSGQASWCELASEASSLLGLHCAIHAIPSEDFPQKATRPSYSVLSLNAFTKVTGITPRPWVQALREYVFTDLE